VETAAAARARRTSSSPRARTRGRCARRCRGEARFGGRVLHSREYLDAAPFAGQRVLVVGLGNTGAEIALDLCEQGVQVALSVRSPVNIVHRDVLGRPTQRTSLMLARLPARLGDALGALLRDLTVGDLSRFGLRTAARSPLAQLREEAARR
jgi:cation diffusion facilitator CzcD-associated flavoprotein CzcO